MNTTFRRLMLLVGVVELIVPKPAKSQIDENCTVSILNRNVQVNADSTWVIPNIPANFGPVRARATCVQSGVTTYGQSDFFTVAPSQSVSLPAITLGAVTPIPQTVTITSPVQMLSGPSATVQLTVTASYANALNGDLTNSPGTVYSSSNPDIATVTSTGLVTAASGGNFVIRASNEGAAGLIFLQVGGNANLSGTIFHSDGVTTVPSARVNLYTSFPSTLLTSAIGDGQGVYSFTGIPLGNIVLDVTDPATGDRARLSNQLTVSGQTQIDNIILNGVGAVNVTVLGVSGAVPNAQIVLTSQTIFGGTQNATANASGTASVSNVLSGGFTVTATDPVTLASQSVNGNVAAGGTVSVTVTLNNAGATISGVLFSSDGVTPVGGATVRVLNSSNSVVQQTTTAANGSFQFTGLASGTFTLDSIDALNREQARVTGVSVVSGGTVTQNLTLTPLGTVTGKVLNPNGTSAPGVNVALFSGSTISGGAFSKVTDGTGSFTFTNVAVGTFAVSANDSGGLFQGVAAGTVASGQTAQVTIQLASLTPPATGQGIISTVAGSSFVLQGAGGPATNATLGYIQSGVFDAQGNLYVADPSQHMVYKIMPGGALSIFAGTGTAGYSGDGGLAIESLLNSPQDLAIDSSGNLYIADAGNERIRRIDTSGHISTVAGNGTAGFAGDGGSATVASMNFPRGIAVDGAGNLYISDTNNERVRKITGGIITTIVGDGFVDLNGEGRFTGDGGPAISASLNFPRELAVDGSGNLYIADSYNGRIRKVDTTGKITTFAGGGPCCGLGDGGPATSAYLNVYTNIVGLPDDGPHSVRLDSAGNVYISDTDHSRIRKVDTTGKITTIAGNGSPILSGDGGLATSAAINNPDCAVVDAAGNVYISDTSNYRVRKVSAGTITTFAGKGFKFGGDGGSATSAFMNGPSGIAVTAAGNLLISDRGNLRIRQVNTSGLMSTIAGNGTCCFGGDGGAPTNAQFNGVFSVNMTPSGAIIFGDYYSNRIREINTAGTTISTIAGTGAFSFSGDGGKATSATMEWPWETISDPLGNIYFTDQGNNRIRKIDTNGNITTVAGDGNPRYFGDNGLATSASLNQPQGLAFDTTGNLYIADTLNGRVRRISLTGIITTVAGNGAIASGVLNDGGSALNAAMRPSDVAVDSAGGIYIADVEFARVRKVLSDGTIVTVAGGGTANLAPFGDGGLATAAVLSNPQSIALDASGNLYIADSGHDRIRKVAGVIAPVSFFIQPNLNVVLPVGGSASQQLTPTSQLSGVTWTTSVSTNSGGNWLSASVSGTTPTAVTVSTFAGGLAPGVYTGTVTVNVPQASVPVQVINVILTVQPALTPPGPIVTETGGAAFVFSGANGLATNAPLGAIHSVTTDFSGNVYIADPSNNYVFKVSPAGTISIVAGTGVPGNAPDGGLATASPLNAPEGVVVDKKGNVYIAETNGNKIRKVDTNGILSTYAGIGGVQNYSGDGGPAVNAALAFPQAVALDAAGNLYIADTGNSRVRKVDTGGFITTIAGNGTFGFGGDGGPAIFSILNRPSGMAIDAAGNIYIADRNNNRIRLIDTSGNINTLATRAVAEVALDAVGNLYFADGSAWVFKVTGPGLFAPIAGNGFAGLAGDGGPALSASMNGPSSLAFDLAGNLYIADTNNELVRKVNPAGIISTFAGNGNFNFGGDGGPATMANLSGPLRIALDSAGNLYIPDSGNNRVRKIDTTGKISTVAGNGSPTFAGDGGPATLASLRSPQAVATDGAGNLYIADSGNRRVRKVDTTGRITTVAGDGGTAFAGDGIPAVSQSVNTPAGIAVDSLGNLYIADSGNLRVFKVDSSGMINTIAGSGNRGFSGDGGAATAAALNAPFGVAVDAAGNVYFADSTNARIRKITPTGIITTVAGNGIVGFTDDGVPAISSALFNPRAVAIDAAGNLYIADASNDRIRKVNAATGLISTVGGNGNQNLAGDGSLAVSGAYSIPQGVAVDAAGNIYVADTGNNRIRKIQ